MQKSGSIHEQFLKQYLDRNSEEIHTYYQGLVFTGKASIPKQLGSDTELVAYVARTKGAIGYVNDDAATNGVKVLTVASSNPQSQRSLVTRVEPEYPDVLRQRRIGGSVLPRVRSKKY